MGALLAEEVCQVARGEVELLVSTTTDMLMLNSNNTARRVNRPIIDMDTLQSGNMVFWLQQDGLYRAKLGEGEPEMIYSDVDISDHLAVDWVHSNIFLAHNRSILIHRHLRWWHRPTAIARLLMLGASYSRVDGSLRPFWQTLRGFEAGRKAAAKPPLNGRLEAVECTSS